MSNSKQHVSIYGAEGFITTQQYIAELIISRKSKFLKVSLPQKFWSNDKYIDWRKDYLNQLRRVNSLVKAGYSVDIVLDALNTKNGRWICSLFNKKLDFILTEVQRNSEIKEIKETVNDTENLEQKLEVTSTTETKQHIVKESNKTQMAKLRDLD